MGSGKNQNPSPGGIRPPSLAAAGPRGLTGTYPMEVAVHEGFFLGRFPATEGLVRSRTESIYTRAPVVMWNHANAIHSDSAAD